MMKICIYNCNYRFILEFWSDFCNLLKKKKEGRRRGFWGSFIVIAFSRWGQETRHERVGMTCNVRAVSLATATTHKHTHNKNSSLFFKTQIPNQNPLLILKQRLWIGWKWRDPKAKKVIFLNGGVRKWIEILKFGLVYLEERFKVFMSWWEVAVFGGGVAHSTR